MLLLYLVTMCNMHEVRFIKMVFLVSFIFQVVDIRGEEQRKNPAFDGLQSDFNEHAVAHVTGR